MKSIQNNLDSLFQEALKPCKVKKHISIKLGPCQYFIYYEIAFETFPSASHRGCGWVQGKSFSQFHPLRKSHASRMPLAWDSTERQQVVKGSRKPVNSFPLWPRTSSRHYYLSGKHKKCSWAEFLLL